MPDATPQTDPGREPMTEPAPRAVSEDALTQEGVPGAVAPGAVLRRIATGFGFTEGPIWHPTEHWLVFSDIARSRQWRLRDGALESFRHPSNQANGNCFDLDGRVVSCEHASSALVVHDHGGRRVRVLASHHGGAELNSPNDVVCDRRGRLWFTDPSFGRLREDLGILRPEAQPHRGVYRLDPDGTLEVVATELQQPNGLCFSNDGRRLFVNDSWGLTIHVFEIDEASGRLSRGVLWATIEGDGEGVPDGMKVDAAGRVWCNGPGGVHVLSPGAERLGVVRTPEKSTNFCFGGPGRDVLHITASTSVYAVETLTTGAPMIHGAG
jgi:gluconolactonase